MREERKKEHIENYLKTEYHSENLFDDIVLEHNSLPNLSIDDIDTGVEIFGKKLAFPLLINSMTGGAEISYDINRDLAKLADKYGLAMAVGSQKVALESENTAESFVVIKEFLNEDSIKIGNLSASSDLDEIIKAAEMIEADAMQLHLNPCQELVMLDGDRDFRGILENIENIVSNSKIPIIVKEVGFGISAGNARKLYDIGVRYIDIAGSGGTNFIEIEDLRRHDFDFSDIYSWGNSTPQLLYEYRDMPKDLFVIASGGIRTGLDIIKSYVMGADLVGISGELLNYLAHGGYEYASDFLESLIEKTKILMLLLGCKRVEELRKVKYKPVGKLRELVD
ncbi:MAG: type 2 isopentenyl-diphosphate Delta-isomerase [Tissierellia bacterium]|nr:type 2 isopentenyl-diphosphate Delta-isomerase [Tissierellia bacterium]